MVLLFHSARDEAKGWLHCKEKKKCTPPLQERLCDLSVYMTGKVGDAKKDFKIGVLHCEIKSREKYFPQICHEMTVVLQYVPRAFALSIREFEISFYQFEWNPITSKIEVHEHEKQDKWVRRPVQNDRDLEKNLQFFTKIHESNFSLKTICRKSVRKLLLQHDTHENLFNRIPKLQIPKELGQYLLYDVNLDDDFNDWQYIKLQAQYK